MTGLNISTFFIGFSTAFYSIFAVLFLKFRKENTRYSRIIGIIMTVWALWSFKDIILTFPGFYNDETLNWVLIIDGWSALTYTVFVFEAIKPYSISIGRLTILALPFLAFTVWFYLMPTMTVIKCYVIFLWFYAWTVVAVGWVGARRYLRYVRENYSNIDKIDIFWLKPVIIFTIVSQLSWLATSLVNTVWLDVIYYISTILLWLIVLYYTWNFRPIIMKPEDRMPQQQVKDFPFAGSLEKIVEEEKLYLNKNLTINDLAQAVKSNRTYVSNYLRSVMGMTFYDYINKLRIERGSIPLMSDHPKYKLEWIATESGFCSISTFRRAFVKFTGCKPHQYREQLLNAENPTCHAE